MSEPTFFKCARKKNPSIFRPRQPKPQCNAQHMMYHTQCSKQQNHKGKHEFLVVWS